jgi:hypothetical protein
LSDATVSDIVLADGSPMPISLVLERVLWFAPPVLLAVMAVSMVRRKLHRELPWFFAYTIFDACQSVFSWFLWDNKALYFYHYWVTELVSVIIGFVIIYEVFSKIVNRYERVQRVGFVLYRWSAVVLLFVATITVAIAPDMNSSAIFDGIVTLQRGVRIVQTGLLIFLFAFASFLALSWRNCAFGVALGFGLLAVVELILATVRSFVGPAFDQLYAVLKAIAYNSAALIWAVYVLQRQPAVKKITSLPKTDVAVWSDTLTELVRR